ncbi:major capsid protein [Roseibium album]|uniref:major capsid protein n=1 Tax=Roseibium album TaxID=311410 RepID=UPI003919CA55
MAHMDIFNNDAFGMVELSGAIQEVDYIPQLLDSIGLFEEKGVYLRDISIEKKGSVLSLISTSPNGEPPRQTTGNKPNIRNFKSQRLADGFTLYASEVAGMRAFGSQSELMVVMTEYAERMGDVRNNMDLTHEFHRLGALQGKLLDADGTTVIYDYFDEFGIVEPAAIDFELGTANTKVRLKCAEVKRRMVRAGKGAVNMRTSVHALCGDDWYDSLIEHDAVKRTYENWAAAADLRDDRTFESFSFGGITFHNYRGTDDNSEVAIPVDEAKFFPVNANGVFKKFMSPADEFAPFVNTKGQDTYAINVEDKDRQSWVKGELYSYPLYMCARPEVLQKGT